jgi:hypothetical protein
MTSGARVLWDCVLARFKVDEVGYLVRGLPVPRWSMLYSEVMVSLPQGVWGSEEL